MRGEAEGAGASETRWRSWEGDGVTVSAPGDSAVVRQAERELRAAERVVEGLAELLELPDDRRGGRVAVYLVDPPVGDDLLPPGIGPGPGDEASAGAPTPGEGGIVRIVDAEAAEHVGWDLVPVLVSRWLGAGAAAFPFLEGLAGVVVAREREAGDVEAADLWIRNELNAGRTVSVLRPGSSGGAAGPAAAAGPQGPPGILEDVPMGAILGPPVEGLGGIGPPPGAGAPTIGEDPAEGMVPPDGMVPPEGMVPPDGMVPPAMPGSSTDAAEAGASSDAHRTAATSFVGYLHRSFGGAALRRVLESFDPERRDQATMREYQLPLGALEEAWLGSVRSEGERQSVRDFLGYLLPLFKPYWWRQAEVVLYMILGSLFVVLSMPVAIGAVVGALAPDAAVQGDTGGPVAGLVDGLQQWLAEGDTLPRLLVFVSGLVVLYALDALVAMRRAIVSEAIAQGLLISLQERMFEHVQRLPHDFYAAAKVGDLMTRLSGDLQGVSTAMTGILNTGLFLVISTVTAVTAVVSLDLRLSLLVLVVAPIFVVSYKVLGARLAAASYQRMMRTGEAATVTQESLSAHAVIKAFGLERRTVTAYRARLLGMMGSALRMARISSLYDAVGDIAITLGQLIVLAYGGYLVIDGQMEVAILVAFLGILPSLLLPLSGFSDIGQMVQMASGSLRRVTELLEQPLPISDRSGATPLAPLEREVRFEGVTFGYAADRPVLRDFDLTIPAGTHAAIVGPSGSGKSTVVNLLLRFWDPQDGRVLLDGADVRDRTLASLRGQIGLVFQDTFIFDTTVRENIAIGRPDATDAEIRVAAEGARLAEFVEALPSGFESVLGERGTRMSGGQRQRLAIARVLLRDPKIMVLDEATSALDAQTEAEILDTLRSAIRGRTTITITHRLSLAAAADVVFVLEQGRLVERGSHDELREAGGSYQEMYETQMGYARQGGASTGIDVERLREIPLLSGLSGEELAAVGARLRPERLPAGRVVVRQGETGERLYLIDGGRAEVLVGPDGAERPVSVLGAGDVFGEMATLGGVPRNATVRTMEPTLVYSLGREDLKRLMDQRPDIRDALVDTATRRRAALADAVALARSGPNVLPPSQDEPR